MLLRISGVVLTVILAVMLLILSTAREPQTAALHARQGILDLSTWNPKLENRIRLDGEWEFYWKKLLPASQQGTLGTPDAYAEVPGTWGPIQLGDKRLPSYGFATYRLVLRNTPIEGTLAIKKSNIRFASEIYVNGTKLMEDGQAVEKCRIPGRQFTTNRIFPVSWR